MVDLGLVRTRDSRNPSCCKRFHLSNTICLVPICVIPTAAQTEKRQSRKLSPHPESILYRSFDALDGDSGRRNETSGVADDRLTEYKVFVRLQTQVIEVPTQ